MFEKLRVRSWVDEIFVPRSREYGLRQPLVDMIADLSGFKGNIIWDTGKPGGQPRCCLDTSRAERESGWRAKTSLEQGLGRSIEWYRTHRHDLEAN